MIKPESAKSFSEEEAELPHLLIVDDDARLRSALRRYLIRSGFRVTEAEDTKDARAKLQGFTFDLLVLDVMMPGESGLELLSDIRLTTKVPVLILSAVIDVGARIDGLERGADDYLPKPFEPRELVLRILNILSRAAIQPPQPFQTRALQLGNCSYDLAREELTRDGERVHLTSGETALLTALAKSPGEPLSRDALNAYGQFLGSERTVDVQITRLRRKIEGNPKYPRYLQTIRGIGYVLKPD